MLQMEKDNTCLPWSLATASISCAVCLAVLLAIVVTSYIMNGYHLLPNSSV